MNLERKTAITAGVLFIIGTAAPVLGMGLTGSIMSSPDYLNLISANGNLIITSAFLQIVMGFACAGIAMVLYPVLRKSSETLAVGAVGFRLIEGLLAGIAATGLLVLVTVSSEFINAGITEKPGIQRLARLLLDAREQLNLVALFAWCISALMYYTVFFRTGLVPRWVSLWGLIGITLTMIANFLVLFRIVKSFSTIQVIMNLPIALQEMVFAVWLIAKGFDRNALAELSRKNS